MKVKVKDIAKAAGVSTTAVSLVLNDKSCRLSESTKEHILRIAREMKFQNENHMNFGSTGKVKTIGLVIPDIQNLFYQQVTLAVTRYLSGEGYMVFQCGVDEDLKNSYHALECLTSKNVDGIIVIPPCIHSKDDKLIKMMKLLQDSGVPMILVDRAVYSVFCDFITADNKQGGKIAAEYLISKGHKKVGCILGNKEVYTVRKRLEGYKQALAQHYITFDEELVFYGEYNAETGIHGTEYLMSKGVSAVFAGNDEIAYGIYQYAQLEGIRIPEDLSVIGFDNTRICSLLQPNLTSVEQNASQIGERAAEVMLQNINPADHETAPRNYYFTPYLVERASVAEVL